MILHFSQALFFCLLLTGSSLGQLAPNFQTGRAGIVHMFEWNWDAIADECEQFLGPAGYAGVQISPPQENRIIEGRPWWERYQPVSYVLTTRSGDRQSLGNMIDRCRAAGVEVYADVVINHMCGEGGTGTGTGGSYFDANTYDFPAVPFTALDMNDANCYSSSGMVENMADLNEVRNCKLFGLIDVNTGNDNVRAKIVAFMNDLIQLGVAGFRIDACKHMWPEDIGAVVGALTNLNEGKGHAYGTRPFVYQEVIEEEGEPVLASQYFGVGRVTEFKYGILIHENKDSIHKLSDFGESWGMMPDENALVFLNNHDNQRGHGNGRDVISFQDPYNLKILNAFMMAWSYGVPRIMSSYYFTDSDVGPPAQAPSVETDGSCGNGWVCEHRWPQIRNMVAFAAAAEGEKVSNWWSNMNNQIAFSRADKAFIAINKSGYTMSERLYAGLARGSYCNVFGGDPTQQGCNGKCVEVDGNGYANIYIEGQDSDPVVALHVNAMC